MRNYLNNRVCPISIVFLITTLCAVFSSSVSYAIGVGAVNVNSFIGDRLNANIGLFNVQSPAQLTVEFSGHDEQTVNLVSRLNLSVSISTANNQLTAVINSEKTVNEPYVRFYLTFNDQGTIVTKEFTALLDLSPQVVTLGDAATQLISNDPQRITQHDSGLMGPYDWAESNNIPSRFGAVLDGQSLWRVARRINKALGVSINQMMWALYVTNPDAFSTKSIDSLQAGSYLDIPSFTMASRLSDFEAGQKLNSLSSHSVAQQQVVTLSDDDVAIKSEVSDDKPIDNTESVETAAEPEPNNDSAPVEEEVFRLSPITDTESKNDNALFSDKDNAQQVITSLAATVGNLTQELINKDKRIQFLEEKVEALEKLQAISIDSTVLLTQQPAPVELAVRDDRASESEVAMIEQKPARYGWLWVFLAVMALLGLVLYLLRERLIALWQNLNFFGDDEDVEFESSAIEQVSDEQVEIDRPSIQDKDFSTLLALQKELGSSADNDSELEFYNSSHYEVQHHSSMEVDVSDMEFDDRFSHLVSEQDFEFAKELLDFAKNNEINEHEYGYYCLKLYQAMNDEQGFYDYYYKIESKLPEYDMELQTKISELVVAIGSA